VPLTNESGTIDAAIKKPTIIINETQLNQVSIKLK
jgi:hypothetical protein